jgi:Tol biopolymer transport system component
MPSSCTLKHFGVFLWVLLALFPVACGTLEVRLDDSPTSVGTATPLISVPTTLSQLRSTAVPTATVSDVAVRLGSPANDHSGSPVISADGRYVLFTSVASNLVPGRSHGDDNVYVYDREGQTVELLRLAGEGSEAESLSYQLDVSANGRWLVFTSEASNLVTGDTNGLSDVFVHDRQKGSTSLVSVSVEGESGKGMSMEPSISADGRWIAFTSYASDLVPEVDEHTGKASADTNQKGDIFVYDRLGNGIQRVSLSSTGEQGNHNSAQPGISADGRYVVYWSLASNLVLGAGRGIYLHDRATGTTEWIAGGMAPTISPDGRWIGFLPISSDPPGDDAMNVAIYDRQTGEVTIIGGYAKVVEGQPSKVVQFSEGGEWLAFSSVFASPDGPLRGDSTEWGQQAFLWDRQTATFTLVSATPDGRPGNSISAAPSLSADGRWVAFQSLADNLVARDTNRYMDVFLYDRKTGLVEMVTWAEEER